MSLCVCRMACRVCKKKGYLDCVTSKACEACLVSVSYTHFLQIKSVVSNDGDIMWWNKTRE